MVKSVDTRDLKSLAVKSVPVRVRLPAPIKKASPKGLAFLFLKKEASVVDASFGYLTYSMTTRRLGSTPVEWVVMFSMSCRAAWITWRS